MKFSYNWANKNRYDVPAISSDNTFKFTSVDAEIILNRKEVKATQFRFCTLINPYQHVLQF